MGSEMCIRDRPGPAHQFFRGWAAARPSPSHFQKLTARPGPADRMAARPMRHGLYMARPDHYVGRPMCYPVLKSACAYADVIFFALIVVFSLLLSRLDSVGQPLSVHETHIASTHYSNNCAPPTTRSDGFLWTTTSSCCCCDARSSSNSSSTCCCNTRCCCTARWCIIRYCSTASTGQHSAISPHTRRIDLF